MRCGKMLKDEVAEYCEDCAKRKSYITQGRSLWLHQKPVSDALYRFKYHNKRCYGLVFSEKLAEKYEKKLKEWKIGLILPIPLHWKRKRKRGYNQAEILARELGKRTGLAAIHLNEENELFFELFVSLMRLSYQRKIREMKQWSEQLAGMGRERQKNFLTYAQRMIRENFIYNLHCKEMSYMTLPEQNFATRFAPFINERNVMGMMDELSEAQIHIEQNVNARMVFFDFSLKMIVLLKQ